MPSNTFENNKKPHQKMSPCPRSPRALGWPLLPSCPNITQAGWLSLLLQVAPEGPGARLCRMVAAQGLASTSRLGARPKGHSHALPARELSQRLNFTAVRSEAPAEDIRGALQIQKTIASQRHWQQQVHFAGSSVSQLAGKQRHIP